MMGLTPYEEEDVYRPDYVAGNWLNSVVVGPVRLRQQRAYSHTRTHCGSSRADRLNFPVYTCYPSSARKYGSTDDWDWPRFAPVTTDPLPSPPPPSPDAAAPPTPPAPASTFSAAVEPPSGAPRRLQFASGPPSTAEPLHAAGVGRPQQVETFAAHVERGSRGTQAPGDDSAGERIRGSAWSRSSDSASATPGTDAPGGHAEVPASPRRRQRTGEGDPAGASAVGDPNAPRPLPAAQISAAADSAMHAQAPKGGNAAASKPAPRRAPGPYTGEPMDVRALRRHLMDAALGGGVSTHQTMRDQC